MFDDSKLSLTRHTLIVYWTISNLAFKLSFTNLFCNSYSGLWSVTSEQHIVSYIQKHRLLKFYQSQINNRRLPIKTNFRYSVETHLAIFSNDDLDLWYMPWNRIGLFKLKIIKYPVWWKYVWANFCYCAETNILWIFLTDI